MSDQKPSQIGWVSPPKKPSPIYDADAKTSRVAVAFGVLIIAGVIALSWWINHR